MPTSSLLRMQSWAEYVFSTDTSPWFSFPGLSYRCGFKIFQLEKSWHIFQLKTDTCTQTILFVIRIACWFFINHFMDKCDWWLHERNKNIIYYVVPTFPSAWVENLGNNLACTCGTMVSSQRLEILGINIYPIQMLYIFRKSAHSFLRSNYTIRTDFTTCLELSINPPFTHAHASLLPWPQYCPRKHTFKFQPVIILPFVIFSILEQFVQQYWVLYDSSKPNSVRHQSSMAHPMSRNRYHVYYLFVPFTDSALNRGRWQTLSKINYLLNYLNYMMKIIFFLHNR